MSLFFFFFTCSIYGLHTTHNQTPCCDAIKSALHNILESTPRDSCLSGTHQFLKQRVWHHVLVVAHRTRRNQIVTRGDKLVDIAHDFPTRRVQATGGGGASGSRSGTLKHRLEKRCLWANTNTRRLRRTIVARPHGDPKRSDRWNVVNRQRYAVRKTGRCGIVLVQGKCGAATLNVPELVRRMIDQDIVCANGRRHRCGARQQHRRWAHR